MFVVSNVITLAKRFINIYKSYFEHAQKAFDTLMCRM